MPGVEARKEILEVLVKRFRFQTEVQDFQPYAEKTEGFSGADLQLVLTTAYRFASLEANYEGDILIKKQHLDRALEDFIPTSRDQEAIDEMTLIALNECRSRRLLPPGHEQMREAILHRQNGD
jgi:SpoVK/Ycf46/Vps4 family AAA+-type ATPase